MDKETRNYVIGFALLIIVATGIAIIAIVNNNYLSSGIFHYTNKVILQVQTLSFIFC
jgi:hypothetical protein